MEAPITPDEARLALDAVERGRLRVIDEIGLPAGTGGGSRWAGSLLA